MENQDLIQQEIVRAILTDREKRKPIKQTIKELAREFSLTEFMVRGIIEASALYGLEQVQGPKAGGKKWVPLNHTEAIKRLEDRIYSLETELVKLRNSIERELHGKGIISRRFGERNERDPHGARQSISQDAEIKRLRAEIDQVRDRLESSTVSRGKPTSLLCYGLEEIKK